MSKFKVGDRVTVSDEKEATRTGAAVHLGELGTITGVHSTGCAWVAIDIDPDKERPWSIPEDGLELFKPEILKAYKGFRVIDGKLVSLVAWQDQLPGGVNYVPPVLEYSEGHITYAPKGTQGILFSKDFETCKVTTTKNGGNTSIRVIHEVTPLGKQTKGYDNMDVCPAVLVGEEVWEINKPAPPEKPKEEWVDVTTECSVKWIEASCTRNKGSYYIHLVHENETVANIGYGVRSFKTGYRIEQGIEDYLTGMATVRVFKKVTV